MKNVRNEITSEANLAPITLFVYNRLDHTVQTINALRKNDLASNSKLIIYSDCFKDENDRVKVNQVREYIKNIKGFKSICIFERDKNLGLADSIIDGVTKTVNQYGKIIVLEDDLITNPNFLRFMNNALDFYKNNENVYSITGYSYTNDISNLSDSYFLKLTNSWSWATWSQKWACFQREHKHIKEISKATNTVKRLFNFDNSYDFMNMLNSQQDDNCNSWAIYWYLSVFKKMDLHCILDKHWLEI